MGHSLPGENPKEIPFFLSLLKDSSTSRLVNLQFPTVMMVIYVAMLKTLKVDVNMFYLPNS